jgi:DUF1680 family protein
MEGLKPYMANQDLNCCLSSGPRGLALIPTLALTTDPAGLVVNLYDAGTANLVLTSGTAVKLAIETSYPAQGGVHLRVEPSVPEEFPLKLRIPEWCSRCSPRVNGQEASEKKGPDGYLAIQRRWQAGDRVDLQLDLRPRLQMGDHRNAGKAAVLYGPLVLAVDEALPGNGMPPLKDLAIATTDPKALAFESEPAPAPFRTWPGARVYRINAVNRLDPGAKLAIRLLPFAEAGQTGGNYKVWLPLTQSH